MPKASGVTGCALPGFNFATTASADFSRRRSSSPFQAQGEISPGKGRGLRCTIAGSTPSAFGRENFTYPSTLVLARSALYPVSVRRLTASAPRFFQCRPRGRYHFTLRLARGPYDQVPRRTLTSWSRPCWAHPGGPGGLLPRGSHGSGLAQLRHPARQVTGSLRVGTLSGQRAVSQVGTLSRSPPSGPSTKDDWNDVPTTCARCV
jgi:hypothetical protein